MDTSVHLNGGTSSERGHGLLLRKGLLCSEVGKQCSARIFVGMVALFVLGVLGNASLAQEETAREVIAPSVASPTSIHAADLDGDGDEDYLVASGDDGKVAWYENKGGSFSSQQVITSEVSGVQSVYAADVDGDGNLDVLSASEEKNEVAWYRNDGSGFEEKRVIADDDTKAKSVRAADIDDDGHVEVVVASEAGVTRYDHDGSPTDGGWTDDSLNRNSGFQAQAIYVADVNGDGRPDVLYASSDLSEVGWFENLGEGGTFSFSSAKAIDGEAQYAQDVHAADVDEDGDLDIVAAASGAFSTDYNVVWYENTGDSFSEANVIDSNADNAGSVHLTDVNGDDAPDVLAATGGFDSSVRWYENTGGAFGGANVITSSVDEPVEVYASDLDEDDASDVLLSSGGSDTVGWLRNTSEGFSELNALSFTMDGARSARVADVDGDGRQDVIAVAAAEDKIAWFENTGETFRYRTVASGLENVPEYVRAADVDGDGDQDLVSIAGGGSATVSWYENVGDSFADANVISTEVKQNIGGMSLADVDGDGYKDVITASWDTDGGQVVHYENTGGGFGNRSVVTTTDADGTTNGQIQALHAADLDGDDFPEIISHEYGQNSVGTEKDYIFTIENDNGTFGDRSTLWGELNDVRSVFAADLDGDGTRNVLAGGTGVNVDEPADIIWFSGSGINGVTTEADNTISLFAADLDDDGDQDILSASKPSAGENKIAWYENTGDSFGEQIVLNSPIGPNSVHAGDLDGDGAPEALAGWGTTGTDSFGRIVWYDIPPKPEDTTPPEAPSGVTATATQDEVMLEWDEVTAEDLSGYNVYRSSSSFSDTSNATRINESLLSSPSYTDVDVDSEATYYYRVVAVDEAGNSSDASNEASATIPSDLEAPQNLTATATDDPAVDLAWDAITDGALERYRIYRSTDSIDESPSELSPVDSVGPSTASFADDSAEPGATHYYRLTAVDTTGGESGFSNEASAFLYPAEVTASVDRSFGGATDSTGYRLVALPGAADRSLGDAVDGEAGTEWQAYWDDGSAEDFLIRFDGSDTFRFQAGNGFWLTATSNWTFDESVQTLDLRGDSAAAIGVREGWNVISNPLDKDVDWAAVEAATGADLQPIWAFEGAFDSTATFASAATGEAYYYFNDNADRDSLVIPYPGAPGEKAAPASGSDGASLPALTAIPVEQETGGSTVHFGIEEGAELGLGPEDLVAPPGQFEETSLRIEAPEEAEDGRARTLMTERRPPAERSGGHTFALRLTSRSEGPVELRTQGWDSIDGREAVLLYPATGESYDLQREETITVDLSEGEPAQLSLAVGSEAYVDDKTEAVRPTDLKLTSYPNPVRKQGTFEYALPEEMNVTLTVYDVLGREVATLDRGEKPAGRHTVQLETDRLSSGLYFGRLQAGDRVLTQKVTVVR